jgi:hypothetical protein
MPSFNFSCGGQSESKPADVQNAITPNFTWSIFPNPR